MRKIQYKPWNYDRQLIQLCTALPKDAPVPATTSAPPTVGLTTPIRATSVKPEASQPTQGATTNVLSFSNAPRRPADHVVLSSPARRGAGKRIRGLGIR